MFMVAVLNNLPELVLAITWTTVIFWLGTKYGRWRSAR